MGAGACVKYETKVTAAACATRRARTDAHRSLETLLTSRRSSPAPSSSPHSVRPPRRSEAGPGSRSARWRRRHPACGSPEESDPPFPGSPSLRCTRAVCLPCRSGEGFVSCFFFCFFFPPRPLPRYPSRFRTAHTPDQCWAGPRIDGGSSACRITSARTLSTAERVHSSPPSTGGEEEDEDDLLYFLRGRSLHFSTLAARW